ncbi:TPA: hypothetical protein N0F65_001911 [Lagenidium giganteum]|uniref:CFA20 domain-containing protein n=1 Tax=Lagenidium giganteum TaxID=4803 RepID=A0AAV2Z4P1_9STRA|nr:TPA: hypothetical protein N0F65_001911 [Lagenidium giganteum]
MSSLLLKRAVESGEGSGPAKRPHVQLEDGGSGALDGADDAEEAEEIEMSEEEVVDHVDDASAAPPPAQTTAEGASSDATSVPTPPSDMMVLAPPMKTTYASWEEFEASLKEYMHSTFQLYVIRTTTSVVRRNKRIAELSALGPSHSATSGPNAAETTSSATKTALTTTEATAPTAAVEGALATEHGPLMIPEKYQWYSKTLMCTHGWKDRRRGQGKRTMSALRSTACPAKMCVTLQQRTENGESTWQVVVTKHVRAHNHKISKELSLFYSENRRIYDPELLRVTTSGDQLSSASSGHGTAGVFLSHPTVHSDPNALIVAPPGHVHAAALHPMAQTASTEAQTTIVHAPKIVKKDYVSWDEFAATIKQYAKTTHQTFRVRSTISTQFKNAKTIDQAQKQNKDEADVQGQLIPNSWRWYSKMLICSHGWKRKSRSKSNRLSPGGNNQANVNACPAMLLVRLQRDQHENWKVVINRQVLDHNHDLDAVDDEDQQGVAIDHISEVAPVSTDHASNDAEHSQIDAHEADDQGDDVDQSNERSDVVVRVPTIPVLHESWEAFHECLKTYSDKTFQLYRTRTTSSVKGRNQKILDLKGTNNTDGDQAASGDLRMIPEEFKWYSKTLTCTHGWKERRRGTGKRAVQVFRSTSCPVKICATLQFVKPHEHFLDPAVRETVDADGAWRVVVTKHIIDHNHNLSKELHQHYCENRRIYDPDLLAIDQSADATAALTKSKPLSGVTSVTSISTAGANESFSSSSTAALNPSPPPPAPNAPTTTPAPPASMSAMTSGSVASAHMQIPAPNTVPMPLHSLPYGASQALAFVVGATNSYGNANAVQLLQDNGQLIFNPDGMSDGLGAHQSTGSLAYLPYVAVPVVFPGAGSYLPHHSMGTSGIPVNMFMPPNNEASSVPPNGPFSMFPVPVPTVRHMGEANSTCRVHGAPSNENGSRSDAQCTCNAIGAHNPATMSSLPRNSETQAQQLAQLIRFPLPGDAASRTGMSASTAAETTDDRDAGDDNGDVADNDDDDIDEHDGTVWTKNTAPTIQQIHGADGAPQLWRAPRMARYHDSWEAFHDYLTEYSAATFQLYRVRTTSSISSRNARLHQQAAGRGISLVDDHSSPIYSQMIPEKFQWYSKTYVCTHGWKERRRGRGQRVSHSVRSTACEAKACVTLQRDNHNLSVWKVVVTKHNLDHNHELSAEQYQQYCENRRVKDPELLEKAEEMWRSGSSRRKIYEYLKENSSNVLIMKDVHNLVQRWQTLAEKSAKHQSQATDPNDATDVTPDLPIIHARWRCRRNMATTYFQGGDSVELLSAHGKAPASTWKLQRKIVKTFDKAIKANAFLLDGSTETKMQLPKNNGGGTSTGASAAISLGLTQRFLVLQLFIPFTRSFSIEIGFSDFQKIKRRFLFASAFRETARTALHVQVPFSAGGVSRDTWMNLVLDLAALTESYFPGSAFRSMESICISGTCRIKRIFTMKDAPRSDWQRTPAQRNRGVMPVAAYADTKDIPKQFQFTATTSESGAALPAPTEYFIAGSDSDHISETKALKHEKPESALRDTPRAGVKPSSRPTSSLRPTSGRSGTEDLVDARLSRLHAVQDQVSDEDLRDSDNEDDDVSERADQVERDSSLPREGEQNRVDEQFTDEEEQNQEPDDDDASFDFDLAEDEQTELRASHTHKSVEEPHEKTHSPVKRSLKAAPAPFLQHSLASPLLRKSGNQTLSHRLRSLLESTDWSKLDSPLTDDAQRVFQAETAARSSEPERKRSADPVSAQSRAHRGSSLELIYDPVLQCYQDPVTRKYYARIDS